MAVNEKIQTGRKFRKLIDEDSRLWLRISFWTKASDVEFDDGETAETKLSNVENRIHDIVTSFQDGVNKIYNYLKGLGFTPTINSPDGICQAIQKVFDDRYNAGKRQGQEDVKTNPEEFGISTGIAPEQFTMYSAREDFPVTNVSLIVPHNGTCNLKFEIFASYTQAHNANTLSVKILRGNSEIIYETFDRDVTNGGGEYRWDKTIQVSNCTKGETLTFQLNSTGSDASWITGLY